MIDILSSQSFKSTDLHLRPGLHGMRVAIRSHPIDSLHPMLNEMSLDYDVDISIYPQMLVVGSTYLSIPSSSVLSRYASHPSLSPSHSNDPTRSSEKPIPCLVMSIWKSSGLVRAMVVVWRIP